MSLNLRLTADSNPSLSAINDLRLSTQFSSAGLVAILWLLALCWAQTGAAFESSLLSIVNDLPTRELGLRARRRSQKPLYESNHPCQLVIHSLALAQATF